MRIFHLAVFNRIKLADMGKYHLKREETPEKGSKILLFTDGLTEAAKAREPEKYFSGIIDNELSMH